MRPQPHIAAVKTLVCVVVALALLKVNGTAWARYVQAQLENTPIDRLVDNLTEQIEAMPQDAKLRHNLARLHAMAYASKSETAPTMKGAKDASVWFGYEPRPVPFVNKPTDDAQKLKTANAHLAQAIANYKQVLQLDATNLIARLGHAWCLEQAGQDMQAIDAYRETIELGWNKEKEMRFAPLGWHSIVAEAFRYLKPHLDAQADADEIARNEERIAKVSRIPRPITPIAIPLEDGLGGADIEDRAGAVPFDADGSGEIKHWTWINPNAAWLVYDGKGTREITSALQMFGSVSFWCFWDNGYQALAALDNDGDQQLTGLELEGLALWHDKNSNGISEPGEVRSLAEHQIVALSCVWQTDATHPSHIAFSPMGVEFSDGTRRPSFDIVLRTPADES